MTRGKRLGDVVALPYDSTTPPAKRPTGVIRAMKKSLESLIANQGSHFASCPGIDTNTPSIASTILEFATGRSSTCSAGRNFALLYLALQGMVVPIGVAAKGMDSEQRKWWLRAISEHVTDRWDGNAEGVLAIATAQPDIWEQTLAATKIWAQVETRETSNDE